MHGKGLALALLAWVLWAQGHGVVDVNDTVMLQGNPDGIWRYIEGFDLRQQCVDRRKALIEAQQAKLPGLTPEDLDTFRYREYKCVPETIDPTNLTRQRSLMEE